MLDRYVMLFLVRLFCDFSGVKHLLVCVLRFPGGWEMAVLPDGRKRKNEE